MPSLKEKSKKLKNMLLLSHLAPLPIYDFSDDHEPATEKAVGEFGCVFPHIDHISMSEPVADEGCPVGNGSRSRRLANVMSELETRFWKKVNQNAKQTLVYDRPSMETPSKEYVPAHNDPTSLRFNSWFESGNLQCAYRVYNRNYESYLPQCTKHLDSNDGAAEALIFPMAVDQEYDLFCDFDTYTYGHIQWYYFQVKVNFPMEQDSLLVRFNIRNMMKRDSLYNYGMLPTVYSEAMASQKIAGWTHAGEEAFYFTNSIEINHCKRQRNHSTLSFVYRFNKSWGNDTVYFAHCYPYTYTNLQNYLNSLVACPQRSLTFRRRKLCSTVCGNACEMLTITEHTNEPRVLMMRTGVVLTARVHPGETNGSFVMQGIIDFLTGPSKEAQRLRQCFIFKVIPMLNPDGVIHGNYRCSLAGVDLNRRWSKPSQIHHPTIYAAKQMISSLRKSRRVVLFCDIHGHSRKKNMFIYGCKPYLTWSKFEAAKVRLFPFLLSKVSSADQGGYFSFPDCTFNVRRSKQSTGRVSVWNDMRILNSFTLEASFCGTGVNQKKQSMDSKRQNMPYRPPSVENATTHYMVKDLIQSGEKFCCALSNYSRLLAIEPIDETNFEPLQDPNSQFTTSSNGSFDDTTGEYKTGATDTSKTQENDFTFSLEAMNILDEITSTTPLTAEMDCNSSEASSGSDSAPSEDNMDPADLEKNSRWLAAVNNRNNRARSTCKTKPPPLEHSISFNTTVNTPPRRLSTKNILKALPSVPVLRPTTEKDLEAKSAREQPKPVTVAPQTTRQLTKPIEIPSRRRLSVWNNDLNGKPDDANAAIAGLHRELIKRRISFSSPPKL